MFPYLTDHAFFGSNFGPAFNYLDANKKLSGAFCAQCPVGFKHWADFLIRTNFDVFPSTVDWKAARNAGSTNHGKFGAQQAFCDSFSQHGKFFTTITLENLPNGVGTLLISGVWLPSKWKYCFPLLTFFFCVSS